MIEPSEHKNVQRARGIMESIQEIDPRDPDVDRGALWDLYLRAHNIWQAIYDYHMASDD